MGLNRMMMGQNVDLKNIKAMMTVGINGNVSVGFSAEKGYGVISPNPLPNGIKVEQCRSSGKQLFLLPATIKSVTINKTKINHKQYIVDVEKYLKANVGKTISVIFHFD